MRETQRSRELSTRELERLIQFVLVGEREEDFARFWKLLIEYALLQSEASLSLSEIAAALTEGSGVATLPVGSIAAHVGELKQAGRVLESEGRYRLALQRAAEMREGMRNSADVRRRFEDLVLDRISARLPSPPAIDKRKIQSALTEFTASFLEERSVAGLDQSLTFPSQVEIAEYLPFVVASSQKLGTVALRNTYVAELSAVLVEPEWQQYLQQLTRAYAAMWTLRIHPSVSGSLRRISPGGIVVYLDTNVLFRIVLSDPEGDESCPALLEHLRALKVRVAVWSGVLQEWRQVVHAANLRAKWPRDLPPVDHVAGGDRLHRDFERLRASGATFTWEDYVERYDEGLESALRDLGISVDSRQYSAVKDDPDYALTELALSKATAELGGVKSLRARTVDAMQLCLIQHLRDGAAGDPPELYFLLSLDLCLLLACRVLAKRPPPLCLEPSQLLRALVALPLLRGREVSSPHDLAEVVAGFVTSEWGTAAASLAEHRLDDVLRPVLSGGRLADEELVALSRRQLLARYEAPFGDTSPMRGQLAESEGEGTVTQAGATQIRELEQRMQTLRGAVANLRTTRVWLNLVVTALAGAATGIGLWRLLASADVSVAMSKSLLISALLVALALLVSRLWWLGGPVGPILAAMRFYAEVRAFIRSHIGGRNQPR